MENKVINASERLLLIFVDYSYVGGCMRVC